VRDVDIDGYEIHAGVTRVAPGVTRPFAIVTRSGAPGEELDGASDANGAVTGTYLHGIFASGPVRRSLLSWLAARARRPARADWGEAGARPRRWDRLADVVAGSLDVKAIGRLVDRAI
jgi:adenosylcobyric acid synthase